MHIGIAGVHLAAALVNRHKHRLNATGGLRHERRGAGGSDGQTGNVAPSVLHHVGIEFLVGILQSDDKRILLLTLGVEYLESATLLGHRHRRAVGCQCQRAMHVHREVGSLLCSVAQSHGCYHVALGRDAHACAAAHAALLLDFLPQMILCAFHLLALRVALHLLHDLVDLLKLQVHNVIHQALGHGHMLAEQFVVEVSILRKRVHHIRVEVDAQQTTRVVGTERNLAAGIGAHRTEAQVGIAVGNTLTQNGVPEQHTGLSTLPSVVHNLLPQFLCRDLLLYKHLCIAALAIDGELLHVGPVFYGGTHELIVNLHAYVGTCHLALCHLGIDKRLRVGMLDAYAQHQRTTAAILRHLARTITITLHERHQACRGQCRVVHRRALRTNVAQVVAHTAAALHQLHLLLVDAHDGAIRVGIAVETYHKAVRQRSHLMVVANARHRTARRHHIPEMVEQIEDRLCWQRVGIFLLNTGNLVGYTPVHIGGRTLINVAERIFHGIFVHPHTGGQLITAKILKRRGISLIVRICFFRFHLYDCLICLQSYNLSLTK